MGMARAAGVAMAPWVTVASPDNALTKPTDASSARADSAIAQSMVATADQRLRIFAAFPLLDKVRSNRCRAIFATTFSVPPSDTACRSLETPLQQRRPQDRRRQWSAIPGYRETRF